jgi:2-C-methyl-D-erythritol 4-phosphate cytidylyltransferase/2-C-methyl-D-erythritol 2,4-cyclodiphosphate synthase
MGSSTPKQFLSLMGRPLIARTLENLTAWPEFRGVVVVASPQEVERTRGLIEKEGIDRVVRVVPGGDERQDSVRLGLEAFTEASPADVVFVHDGVRPFPPIDQFATLRDAAHPDGAVLALPCRDTLKLEQGGASVETLDRSRVWQAQTPQAFPVALLREAVKVAEKRGFRGTDEAALVEALGRRPRLIPGNPRNIKVTLPEDLTLAENLLRGRPDELHIGHGYDVHRLVEGRRLVLGGVEIPHRFGLLGHSDADVLTHAVADACLGAAGRGDIGRHFPDTDPAWAGVSSLDLLRRVAALIVADGLRALRVDATLVAERPKVSHHIPAMEKNLSEALGLAPGGVTVKATTTEGLGFEGRMQGIAAHAVALVGAVAPRPWSPGYTVRPA